MKKEIFLKDIIISANCALDFKIDHNNNLIVFNDKQIEFYNLLGKPIKYINLDIADEPKRIVTDAKNKIYLFCETDLVIFDQFN